MAELHPPLDQTLDSPSPPADQPVDSGSASEQAPSLVRNLSSSKLNAKAQAFVPTKPQPAERQPTPPPMVITPPPPLPPPVVHIYPQHPPFHVAIPPQSHLHHPQIHHQQGQQQFHQPHPQPHHVQPHQYHPGHHLKHHAYSAGGEEEQEVVAQGQQTSSNRKDQANGSSSNGLSEEATQKTLNQVEYYFSDINLATTDHLIRFMNKDSEGYVPITVVATFKKIKALISSNSQLADVLRNSAKLVVSEDGKKVKRLHPLTGPDMEELQCRIIVAENLPEDHCYQNLMKVFSSVGSVKSIRTCQPQTVNTGAPSASRQSKVDNMIHKLHAFVEYESIELAEKAVIELNDEDNWRNGLKVRLLPKRSSKSQQARGKRAGTPGSEGEGTNEEESTSTSEQIQSDRQLEDHPGDSELQFNENVGEDQGTDKEGGQKKGRNRGRGKGRGRGQNHQNGRGSHHIGSPPINLALNNTEHLTLARPPPGPRMPDGTRGFSMGRGKPVSV